MEREVPAGPPAAFSRILSPSGMLSAGVFFALSLFPSLVPRTGVTQGVISGVTLAIGYGLGTLVAWTWDYLSLPRMRGRAREVVTRTVGGVVLLGIVWASWRHVGWQNDVRGLMGMEPISPTRWPILLAVTSAVAVLLLAVGREVRRIFVALVRWLARRLTARQARLVGVVIMAAVFWGLWTGVLVNGFFAGANAIFSARDTASDVGVTRPTSELRSGGEGSLVAWDTLGRQGRNFVASGPSVARLDELHGGGGLEPIRVYVGLRSADTVEERAQLVLAELRRTGAFEREVLVLATTTGTGWLDADGVDPLEYVHNGDTAIAGVQYSYLPSWISLLADQEKVRETSQVVFDTVHEYWSTLPEATRPEIYLYGLSLGSSGVESILSSINIVNEPIDGALMSGPPFVNDLHERLVATRDPSSPPWLPVVDDGETVRFMAHGTDPERAGSPAQAWGQTRLLYLQYPSDPVVNFSTDLAWTRPAWLVAGRHEDEIADSFRWTPLVTMWQVLADLPAAGAVPKGYGHLYAASDNAVAWVAITRPDDWTAEDMPRLQQLLEARPRS